MRATGIFQGLAARRRRLSGERGDVLVIILLALPLIIILAVFAIDTATIWNARERAQVAADAGALAGAQDIVNGQVVATTATTDATTYVQKDDPNAQQSVVAPYVSGQNRNSVKVTVTKQVPLTFGGLFGLGSSTVTASAVATSDLTTQLGYFGTNTSAMQDGSNTPDGWVNFCANDSNTDSTYNLPATNSFSSAPSADPMRCAGGDPSLWSIDGWTMVHGGVDISQRNFHSPPGTTDQMVDLTGTCVEASGNYPVRNGRGPHSTVINGSNYDGYCQNNADGELEQAISTIPNAKYTVSFWLGSNTYGYPYEKSMLMLASNTDLQQFPPIADTAGNDGFHSASNQYGTVYPLESPAYSSDWSSSGIFSSQEFVYAGPVGTNQSPDPNPNWEQETFTFTAQQSTTYLGFGSLTNCSPDWTSSQNINNSYFWFNPSSVELATPGSTVNPSTSSSLTLQLPPAQVHADNATSSSYADECKYGPGVSDLSVSGPNAITLTQ